MWLGTDGYLGHLTGHAEGTNWAVYAGSDSPTAMVYGPYDTTYGQGHHTAQFKLMVDNNSGSDVIGSLDVVTGFGGNVLATRQVRRSDFTSANQWQNFTLQFDNPCFGTFEARVWWAGNASMKFAQLTITPLEVATSGVQWLVTDQLGTPRMVFDKTGTLSGRYSRRLQIRAAARTARRQNRDGGQAIRTIFGYRFFALSRVHGLHDQENDEPDDQEIDDVVDEHAVGNYRNSFRFRVGERDGIAFRVIENIEQTGQINFAQQQTDERHDDAVNQRGDDLAKSYADDYRYGQINDISARDEILEFFQHLLSS
jgi:hypothetical protein